MNATGGHAAACAVCKLSPERLATLHREHRDGSNVETLMRKYSPPKHPLRKKELRHHLAAHLQFTRTASGETVLISEREGSAKLNAYAALAQYVPDPESVLEASIKGTLRELARCEEQEKTASALGDAIGAERELVKSLKLKAVLLRQVKELDAVREPRKMIARFVFQGSEEAERLTKLRAPAFVKEQRDVVGQAMEEFLRTLRPKMLETGLAKVEQNLHVGLIKFVKDTFIEMSGWFENQVAEAIGSKYIPKEKHAWED